MRTVIVTYISCALLTAQTDSVRVDVTPLAPPDLESPYASPRDAARHRLQATLAELQSSRDLKSAIRGFAEALKLDRNYAAASWDLSIVCALAGKWDDAIAAMEEAVRLDAPTLAKTGATQLERYRMVAPLSKTPEGRRKMRYDVALYQLIQTAGKISPAETMAALANLGRLDPKRWEAPALLAGTNGESHSYEVAAKFLQIAVANAADPDVRTALEKALRAAQREVSYIAARSSAEAATDSGDYKKGAELYESAWAAIPARAENGMSAAANWLAEDDTAHAAGVLLRLKQSGDTNLASTAGRMLAELEAIEPAATKTPPDEGAFFRDAGTAEQPLIRDQLPRIDIKALEIVARPLARMVDDPAPVVLLAALAQERAEGMSAVPLPPLGAPRIVGEQPWSELRALPATVPAPVIERSRESAELSNTPRNARRRVISVTTKPAGASIFVAPSPDPVCQSPCDIRAAVGTYEVRVALPSFADQVVTVQTAGERTDVDLALEPERGTVLVEGPASAAVSVNEQSVAGTVPLEVSVAPGLYRFGIQSGGVKREQSVTVKPGAKLRVAFKP